MSILILAEHNNEQISSATLSCLSAAQKIGGDIHVLVVGQNCATAASAAAEFEGVTKVLCADADAYAYQLAENVAPLVAEQGKAYGHIMVPATANGKNIMPRVAALLDVGMVSDVIAVESADTFKRPIYAGNAVATVQSSDAIKVLSVRVSAFDTAAASGGSASVEQISGSGDAGLSAFDNEEVVVSDRPELTDAKIVVSGGRGVGSKENFEVVFNFADKIGAAVGASRAAVDAGYVPNDLQVGQTGKIVAPELYMAFGVSGAIQHLAGMKDSKVIVAVNKDEEAPIFQVADYGLVADLFDVIPELEQSL